MRKKAIILTVISVIYILGFPLLKNKVLDAKYMITLEITGESNDFSSGTEIWIDSIWCDDTEVDFASLALDGNWENRGRLFNAGIAESKWRLVIRSKNVTKIDFVTHPYSGIIHVMDYDGNITELDLYSEEEGIKSFILNYEKGGGNE